MYEQIDEMQYTPMIRQYLQIKKNYQDMIVFFRLGDFYEMFFNDAIIASKELEIVLTGKDAGVKERVPMCGIPYHAASAYIDKLTEKGYKVAIVEQTEDPANAKGIVTREVVNIITPGTVMEGSLDETENNYLISLALDKDRFIFCYCDLTTGENRLTNLPVNDEVLYAEILKLKSKEIVVDSSFNKSILEPLRNITNFVISVEDEASPISYLKNLSIDLDKQEEKTFLRLLNYIIRLKKKALVHLQKVEKYDSNGYLKIDLSSRRNLELLETIRFKNKKNSLLSVLDKCATAMGTRFLKKNIIFPLVDKEKILNRYDTIDKMKKHFLDTNELRNKLEEVYDLERIIGKISYESCNPKDLLQLKRSLSVIPEVKKLVEKIGISNSYDLSKDYSAYLEVRDLIEKSINEDAPFNLKDGGVIKGGYSDKLDELKLINSNSKEYLINLESKERERTGIKNLKVGFNKVFGYYLEVSKGNIELVKDEFGYIRKQTLANCERYITQELKEKETLILRAEEKMLSLESKIFGEVRDTIKSYSTVLQILAKIISELDMMQSFTKVANENRYVRPVINDEHIIEIKNGRHPVIEKFIKDSFIPNDVMMDKNNTMLLITGPNMSGKSTYMRQVALISIMAQIGSFVPAASCNIPIFDSIFTRIGASDDIVSGQSTFMVEMTEVNNALTNATENSLIIFDEIGRGTATYDGMALAQSIIEYLHENKKCKTLFSTHYHELTTLEEDLSGIKNVHVSAEEVDGEVIFMHKVLKGPADKSYGINVAKLAHIPLEVIIRADDILNKLSQKNVYDSKKMSINNYVAPLLYDSKSDQETYVINEVKNANIYELSPIDAMNLLNELQKKLK